MKTSLSILCVAALSFPALAQVPPSAGDAPILTQALVPENNLASLRAQTPVPLELGESHRIWGTVAEGLPGGLRTNIAFIELASGLAYREAGQLVPAEEIIEAFPGGAIARRGAHKAIFGPNLATDPVEMEMPGGTRLRAIVRGLGYYDRASGKSVLLAEPQNCQGQIVGNKQVVYEGALGGGGGVRCDVAYTWRRSGVEQDVVIRECPPPPDRFGLDPQTTVLEVITEFLDSPQPVRRADLGGSLPEEDLDFGPMRFGAGRAYVEALPEPVDVPVRKQWLHVPEEGRSFLIEQMELPAVERALSALPAAEGASAEPAAGSQRYYVSNGRKLPAAFKPTTATERKPLELAAARPARPGLVADWETIVNSGSLTFESGKTYYISGNVSLGAAIISGNCTIKYTNNASLNVASNLVLLTSAFSPAVFTSCRDNTIGATIPGGSGNPVRLNATFLSHSQTNAVDYKHLRFRYAGTAIANNVTPSVTVWHSQFINCGTCVETCYPAGGYTGRAILYNVLMDGCSSDASSPGSVKVSGAQVTANAVQYLHGVAEWYGEPGSRYYYTNSIARDISNWLGTDPRQMEGGDFSDFSVTDSWQPSPFTQVGAGRFYLPSGSALRDAGKTNLVGTLVSDLKETTTWGPAVLGPSVSTNDLVLSPQVQRETNRPDCGFHYLATDYALCGRYITNASIILEPGTTIAVYGTNGYTYGLVVANASLVAEGTPARPCRLVQYNLVQENTAGNWVLPSYALLTAMYSGSQITLKFAQSSIMAEDTTHVFAWSGLPMLVQDCQFSGGLLDLEYPSLTLKNNLFDGVHSMFAPWDGNHTTLRNNLFKGGTLDYLPYEAESEVKDNVFDQTSIADYSADYGTYDGGYNAFINTPTRLLPTNVNDIMLTSFVYTNGPLGNYYQLSTNLVDRGSQTADLAGLYFHTTRATQTLESNSVVDPGFHHVVVNASGEAVDTDSDGLADYEDPDADGDDLPDVWEIQNGLNPLDPTDAGDDPDGDWLTNLQEYNGGTNSSNPHDLMVVPWGSNNQGQCEVPGNLGDVKAVAAGEGFSLALLNNGSVVGWGGNGYGQTNIPSDLTNAVAIAAGDWHALAVRSDGTISTWGAWSENFSTNKTPVEQPPGLSAVCLAAAGGNHDLVAHSNGTVTAWGGTNSTSYTTVPQTAQWPRSLAAGWSHSVAALTNGSVVAWGENCGGFGWNVTTVPSEAANVTSVAAGGYHTLALRSDGTVVAWGAGNGSNNSLFPYGQSIVPDEATNVIAIAAGGFNSAALRRDGSVIAWGEMDPPTFLGSNVVGIALGWNHGLAIRSGRQWPVVVEEPADLVELPGTNATFSALALGVAEVRYQWQYGGVNLPGRTNATLVLSGISTNDEGGYSVVYSTGAGSVTSRVATLTVVRAPVIAHVSPTAPSTNWLVAGEAGNAFLMQVEATADGTSRYPLRYEWFTNGVALGGATNAEFSINKTTLPWVSIYETNPADMDYTVKVWNPVGTNQAGPWTVRVISTNRWGAVLGWGDNGDGQVRGPVSLTNVLAISTGRYHSVAVREDGGLAYWGYSWTDLPGTLTNLLSAAAGYAHTLGLRRDGSVISWGSWGSEANWVPADLSGVKAIAAGQYHNLALLTNSTVTAWGTNHAELGWHLTEVPTGLTNVTAVAAGYYHSLALKSDGTVVSWGYNDAGQTNVPAGLTNVVGIAAGERFSLAVKADGTVAAWGANGAGQCSVPSGLGNVMAVAAGGDHSAALKTDGTVVCWGSGTRGQLDMPAQVTNITMIAAGGDHTLAGVFSPLVEYPVDVTKDLLLIYNSTSTNSIVVKDYYLAHRPLVGGANELGISCPTNELISWAAFTNQIRPAYLNWLTNHPTRHPHYVILFPDMPTRIWGDVTSVRTISNSVAYEIHHGTPGISPFVTSINMGLDSMGPASLTNDCIGYINKLASFGTNNSLFISASAGGYANTNYVLDDVGYEGYAPNIVVSGAQAGLISAGTPTEAVQIMQAPEPCVRFVTNALDEIGCAEYRAMPHLTNVTGVAGYICWGAHSTLANEYARNGVVAWAGDSGWWIIETIESFNGWRDTGQGNFTQWFCPYAFGGTSYSHTPVGAVTHTDEPNLQGVNRSDVYFALWQRGSCFARCAWVSRDQNNGRFQAVGDPFVRR